jgi:hypothetical protein
MVTSVVCKVMLAYCVQWGLFIRLCVLRIEALRKIVIPNPKT